MLITAEMEARSQFPLCTDWYREVPKRDIWDNLEFRNEINIKAIKSQKFRDEIREACKTDLLFFINTFCFLLEPRPEMIPRPGMHVLPFLSYDYQDDKLLTMLAYLGWKDIGIEKSRDLGATWMVLTLYFWAWVNWPMSNFGIMSRNEKLVDKTGSTDTLFSKLDLLLRGDGRQGGLPHWLRPKTRRNLLLMENLENGAVIEGSPTGPDAFRGGRKLSILTDEFAAFKLGEDTDSLAATQHATASRIILSTPQGPIGEYFKVMTDPDSDMCRIDIDWKDHPDRRKGLYEVKKNVVIELNAENPLTAEQKQRLAEVHDRLRRKGFEVENRQRSPYYDRECLRPGATPRSIAQELDKDYGGSSSKYFLTNVIIRHLESARAPLSIGELRFDLENGLPLGFHESADGPLRLWLRINPVRNKPPEHRRYIVSADIGGGMGGVKTSNSVLSVFDRDTIEKVAELASRTILPMEFGILAVAMCRWFNGRQESAYLIWEDNGTWGDQFRTAVIDSGFRNYYHRRVLDDATRKPSRKPGWKSTRSSKPMLMGQYRMVLSEDGCQNPSKEALEECLHYIVNERGLIVHAGAYNSDDPAGAGENHGDRVIADALGVWAATKELERVGEHRTANVNPWKLSLGEVPENSYLHRRKLWEERQKLEGERAPW